MRKRVTLGSGVGRWIAGAVLPLVVMGCGAQPLPDGALTHDVPFVAIYRNVSSDTIASRQLALSSSGYVSQASSSADQDFYLAINKKELGQRWFLSAYIQQYFPGAVSYAAARSLGTEIVTFKVQNDKLYVFLADDNRKTSDTFDPQTVIEAYPIVTTYAMFNGQRGSDQYVLFDPSAGLNHFDMLSDGFAAGSQPTKFQVELSYLQNFRQIADGVTFEKVFTGYADAADPNAPTLGEPNEFRGSGTLGMALRKYSEGAGFEEVPLPAEENYFRSDPKIVPNTGMTEQTAIHWNIHPGMKPIVWKISNQFVDVQKQFPQYDVIGAVKAGIENWNQVFGFPVLKAEVAAPSDSYSDDDTNYLIYDADPTFGAAFANWRTNPNTGEIRGASVYFNAIWLTGADSSFTDDGAPAMPRVHKTAAKLPTLVWEGLSEQRLCTLMAPEFRPDTGVEVPLPGLGNGVKLTKKQKVEAYVTHTILHEIGHTLGLRHNFKGSLVPASSSVMDYLLDDDAIAMTHPGPYDVDAIKYLYGMSTTPPKQPFCTDEDIATDPDCTQFDTSADPLDDYFGAYYKLFLPREPDVVVNWVLKYVRAGATPAIRLKAWQLATAGIAVGAVPAAKATDLAYVNQADGLLRKLLTRLYLDPAEARGDITADPPANDVALNAAIVAELRGNLLDTDGLRSFATRRICVDILKKMQTQEAFNVLLEAQKTLSQPPGAVSGDAAAQTSDLLARVNVAVSPYFIN